MTSGSSKALLSITSVGGSDGRRPLLMGAIAQTGVGFFYGHHDRWAALFDNQSLGKPIRLHEPRVDSFDENGEITWEGKVDVLSRLRDTRLVLYYGAHKGKPIGSKDDVDIREEYSVDPVPFGHFAEACRLMTLNERALSRLISEISQARRAVAPSSMVVNVEL